MGLPPVRIETNLRLIGHTDLRGAPNIGEGMAIRVEPDGRRILYLAHENPPIGYSGLDVTDPRRPEVVWQLPVPAPHVRGNSLALHGDTLLLAWQTKSAPWAPGVPGQKPAGFSIHDVSDATEPREVSFFDTSGPHSIGVHFVSLMDGKYAHISTGAADFEPTHPNDHQFYMIVDVEDRSRPREVGRWWLPGTRVGDAVAPPTRHPKFDIGFRVHHTLSYPERPDRAYLGYIDAGMITLDISDRSDPTMVSRLDYHPPLPGFTHTVLPIPQRGLAIVTDEASGEEGLDWPKRLWVVDIREESNPVIMSSMPLPDGFEALHREGGRIGAHNLHENEPTPGTARLQDTVVATWFSAGLRIYDIRDPYRPEEIAAFLPETPEGQRGCRISDVFVDDRGIVYAADRAAGGLYILEYTGSVPLA